MRPGLWLAVPLLLWGGCSAPDSPDGSALRRALQIPAYQSALSPEVVKTWGHRDLVFEQVRFQGPNDQWIEALACYSELARSRPLPALLCIPGSGNRKEELLQPLDLMPRWADQGFFVLSTDRPPDEEDLLAQKGLTGMWGFHVHRLIRTLDYLQTRPEVAGERIGMLGLSMGGMEALWLAALDRRVKVVVSTAGHLAWTEVFARGTWRLIFAELPLGRRLLAEGASDGQAWRAFSEVYPQLPELDAGRSAALLAPRPLLLMTGALDPYTPPAATRQVYDAARGAFADSGRAACLEIWVEPEVAHGFSLAMQERALDWFRRWL